MASAKSVPSTLDTKRKVSSLRAVVAQRLVGHHRAQVGAADADVDHGADAPAGVPRPLAGADRVGKARHPVEHRVDRGHDVLAVDEDRRVRGRAQRDVQHGAVLGDVDVLAGEHRVDPPAQAALLGQLDQQPQRLVRDPVLGVVEEQPLGLGRHARAALRIVGEQVAQMLSAELLGVLLERLVRRAVAKRAGAGDPAHGVSSSRAGAGKHKRREGFRVTRRRRGIRLPREGAER